MEGDLEGILEGEEKTRNKLKVVYFSIQQQFSSKLLIRIPSAKYAAPDFSV